MRRENPRNQAHQINLRRNIENVIVSLRALCASVCSVLQPIAEGACADGVEWGMMPFVDD